MIINSDKCFGCGACANICPQRCITFAPDFEGFIQPKVAETVCTKCGLCDSVCPIANDKAGHTCNKAYAIAADDAVRFQSASGGAFYVFAEYILENGGVVCGAVYSDDFTSVRHIVINALDQLPPLLSSKYLQSDIGNCFAELKKNLDCGITALFCGTPCQCAGLRKYLTLTKTDDSKLYIIDLICHCVPSSKAWKLFLNETAERIAMAHELEFCGKKLKSTKYININQRSKQEGWQSNILLQMELELELEDGTIIKHLEFLRNYNDPAWWYVWLRKNAASRKSCYDCQFARKDRQGDITIGDFWGVDEIIPGINDGKGLSFVLAKKKGTKLIEEIAEKCNFTVYKELSFIETERSISNQRGFSGGWSQPTERIVFFDELKASGFYSAYEKLQNFLPDQSISTQERETKYDVGVVGWYYSGNIGDVLTDWATYSFLESLGMDVCMVADPYVPYSRFLPLQKNSFNSVKKYYNMTQYRTPEHLFEINKFCSRFVVAGGAIWNWHFLGSHIDFYDLGFADNQAIKTSCTPGIISLNAEEYMDVVQSTLPPLPVQIPDTNEKPSTISAGQRIKRIIERIFPRFVFQFLLRFYHKVKSSKSIAKRLLRALPYPVKKIVKAAYYRIKRFATRYEAISKPEVTAETTGSLLDKVTANFKRFDKIFIRDEAAADIMRRVFLSEAEQMLDPVMFIDRPRWELLVADCTTELPDNPFIFYYIFEVHFQVISNFHNIASQLGLDEIFLVPTRNQSMEAYCDNRQRVKDCGFETAESTIGNWVKLLLQAQYVICNSFHCACLAIRSNKPFVLLLPRAGDIRFSIIYDLGLADRVISDGFDDYTKIAEVLTKPIDWDAVNRKLNDKIQKDSKSLSSVLLGKR